MSPPPKRALVSLNLASESERVYQRIEDHNRDPDSNVRVLESSGPTAGRTQLEFVTRPFEKLVDRTVESVGEGLGRKIRTVEGEVQTDARREKPSDAPVRTTSKVGNRSRVSKRNRIWETYDTSEL